MAWQLMIAEAIATIFTTRPGHLASPAVFILLIILFEILDVRLYYKATYATCHQVLRRRSQEQAREAQEIELATQALETRIRERGIPIPPPPESPTPPITTADGLLNYRPFISAKLLIWCNYFGKSVMGQGLHGRGGNTLMGYWLSRKEILEDKDRKVDEQEAIDMKGGKGEEEEIVAA
ncbi:hypothetical protein P154DRAFT_619317 [Amniculicola lignicola CBS 123094]|uniref:Uncharacterized protein n=1 Tax=Amniculicola lignicola CBS 123094 TaxID=1392246 RepID=A0A6A5WVL3_9PLEO|nr:hypothetical protein P154DRAFT_619317 [Amniculicola lignicola CBS 123094]